MSKVAIAGNASGTGTFTIQAPNSNTDRVLSLPDEAGTVLTSGTPLSSFPTGFANGVTEYDQWRITADTTATTGNTDITANWERNDTNFEKIGSGMTESSGVFTFPSTGKWMIFSTTYAYAQSSAALYVGHKLAVSTNGGSSYSNYALGYGSSYTANAYTLVHLNLGLDVTSTANFRLKMIAEVDANSNIAGDTTQTRTGITFIRLGDT